MRTAIVTSSYRGDLDRCRLLCESIDRRVAGFTTHYILVEHADVALFRSLAGPRRRIVDERSLLPFWLRPFPDPTTLGRRRVWLSPKGPPLRGWHVQQLRRIAFAAGMDEEAMLSCDSDVVFVNDFDMQSLREGEAIRFYRNPGAITDAMVEHRGWLRQAGRLLGLPESAPLPGTDYIATAIAWRGDTARAMTERIEAATGRSWLSALASTRALSECLIYGRFVDEIEGRPDRHVPTSEPLCHVYWTGGAMDETALGRFKAAMAPGQVAIGIQSFTGTDLGFIRRAAGLR